MKSLTNALLLLLTFVFNINLVQAVNDEPIEMCDYEPNNNRVQFNSPFSSLLTESCGCALFEVTATCELAQSGQRNIIVRVTRLGEVNEIQQTQECASFPVDVEIQRQGQTLLEATTNLVDNAYQEFTVPMAQQPTLVFLQSGPGNSRRLVELVLSNKAECFDSSTKATPYGTFTPSPTPTPSGTFTPTPTPTDTFSPTPTPTCGNGELVCGIEGLTSLGCDSEVTSLVYNAAPQPEYCDDFNYDYPVEAALVQEYPYEIQYSWSYNCLDSKNATVSSGNENGTSSLQIDLTAPGEGKPTTCEVSLTVSRGEESVSCSVPAQVSACILDCNNEINGVATFDACGECGGSGNSCGEKACETQNIAKAQITIDGSARGMARTGTRAANYLAKLVRNKSSLNDLLKQMNNFYVQTWIDTWSINSNILTCTSANNLCSSVSLSVQLDKVTNFGQDLFDFGNKIIDKIEKRGRNKRGHFRVARKLRRQLYRYYNNFTKEVANMPSSQSVCSV